MLGFFLGRCEYGATSVTLRGEEGLHVVRVCVRMEAQKKRGSWV